MSHVLAHCALVAAVAVGVGTKIRADEPQLAHMVYFTLNNRTDHDTQKLVAACKKYLSGHDGTVYFSVGVLAHDLKRDLNDRDFDVALHMVFRNKAAHDQYQTHARHVKFIEENKHLWKKVRVFDAYVAEDGEGDRAR